MTATKPKAVKFLENEDDFQVALCGALGLSTAAIQRKTHLTPCQITYRLHKAKIKRADYRNGYGFAGIVMQKATKYIDVDLRESLAKL